MIDLKNNGMSGIQVNVFLDFYLSMANYAALNHFTQEMLVKHIVEKKAIGDEIKENVASIFGKHLFQEKWYYFITDDIFRILLG